MPIVEALLGVIGIEQDDDDRVGIIRDLAVDPGSRRRGVGRALIEHAQQLFTALRGDTLAEAAGFYRSCGFSITATDPLPDGQVVLRFTWPCS